MKKITFLMALLITSIGFGQTNLLVNGDFETGVTTDNPGWRTPVTSEDPTGFSYVTAAVQAENDITPHGGIWMGRKGDTSANFIQVIDVTAGATYVVNYWVNSTAEANNVSRIREMAPNANGAWMDLTPINDDSGTNADDATKYGLVSDNAWVEVKYSFTVPAGVTQVRTNEWSGSVIRYFDDWSIVDQASLSVEGLSSYNFSYSPNPATDIINLNAMKSIDKVDVINVLGQKAMNAKVSALNKSIDISNLKSGIYMLRVTIGGTVGTYKVIKK